MTDEFKMRLDEKKKEVDQYIARAENSLTKNIFIVLKKELEKINNVNDLESRIMAARYFKKQAKKDATRRAFTVLEKELINLQSSAGGEPGKLQPKAIQKKSVPSKKYTKSLKRTKPRVKKPARTLSDIHRMTGRRKAPAHVKAADRNIALMQKFTVKVPELRLRLEKLQKKAPDHEKTLHDIKRREKEIHQTIKDVSDSIENLKSHIAEKMASEKLKSKLKEQEMILKQKEAEHMIEKSTEQLNMKMEMMSKSLDEALESLSTKIDESSKIGKLEMSGNIEYLKNQIWQIRSELPKFAKKKDIEKVLEQKTPKKRRAKKHRHVSKKRPKPAEKKSTKEQIPAVSISELKNHPGETVIIDADVSPGIRAEESEAVMYGYKLSDGTGEIMMTSLRELPAGRERMVCEVNESMGKIFLRFVKPA